MHAAQDESFRRSDCCDVMWLRYHRDVWDWIQPASNTALDFEHEADAELEDFESSNDSSGTTLLIGSVVAVIGFVYFVFIRGGSRTGKSD